MSDPTVCDAPERILAHRTRHSKSYFLVQRKSFPASEATWVRSSGLRGHPLLLSSYFRTAPQPETTDPDSAPARVVERPTAISPQRKRAPKEAGDPVVWDADRAIAATARLAAVTGRLRGQPECFTVSRSDGSTVVMDRATLIRMQPGLLVDFLERQIAERELG
jgi:hypothetical protein